MANDATKDVTKEIRRTNRWGHVFIALFVSYGVFFLACLWGNWFANAWFYKVTISYVVLLVVLGLTYLVKREFMAEARLKKDKYLD